jgi:hypothetical protein
VEPGDADAVALLDVGHAGADGRHEAHALVAGDERRLRLHRPVALGGVEVGVADAGRLHRDLDLAGAGLGHRDLIDGERLAELPHDGSLHRLCHGFLPNLLRGCRRKITTRSSSKHLVEPSRAPFVR